VSADQMIRTSGTLPIAQHLRPKPRQQPPRYFRYFHYIRRGPPVAGEGEA
jgi:hypothetical protein